MQCDQLVQLLDEVPLPRWGAQSLREANEHCLTCIACSELFAQEQTLRTVFNNLEVPHEIPTVDTSVIAVRLNAHSEKLQLPAIGDMWSIGLVVFLCVGSLVEMYLRSGMTLYWLKLNRLEWVVSASMDAPLLSVGLVFAGLLYCFGHSSWDSVSQLDAPDASHAER